VSGKTRVCGIDVSLAEIAALSW